MKMKNQHIVYIFLFLLAFGVSFLYFFNTEKDLKSSEKKSEIVQNKEDKDNIDFELLDENIQEKSGKGDLENNREIVCASDDTDCQIKKVALETGQTEEKVIADLAEIKNLLEEEGHVFTKNIKLVSSKDIPQDFIDQNNLPEDPGPENDKTLLGIDQNANGVRDDVERSIVYTYQEYPELRDLYLASNIIAQEEIENYESGIYNEQTYSESGKRSEEYVACNRFYSEKYGLSSGLSGIAQMENDTEERRTASSSYGASVNMYELENGIRYRPVASEEFCQNFISQYK